MSAKTYQGGCHCGAVKFEVELDLQQGTTRCNCSFCQQTRNWSAKAQPAQFKLLRGEDALSDYQFNTRSGNHLFCRHCGVRSFGKGYVEQLGGAFVTVQVLSLEGLGDAELAALPITYCDGRDDNWWNAPAETRHL